MTPMQVKMLREGIEGLQSMVGDRSGSKELEEALRQFEAIVRVAHLAKAAERALDDVHMQCRNLLPLQLKEDIVHIAAALRVAIDGVVGAPNVILIRIECFDCTEHFIARNIGDDNVTTQILVPKDWKVEQHRKTVVFRCPHCSKVETFSDRECPFHDGLCPECGLPLSSNISGWSCTNGHGF